jgi:hypothetical protein
MNALFITAVSRCGGIEMKRLLALVTVFALTAAPFASRVEAAPAAAKGPGVAVPVSTVPGSPVTFAGDFRITRFVTSGGKIFAQGVLSGIATRTSDGVTQSVLRTTSMEVNTDQAPTVAGGAGGPAAISQQAVCDILHLVLGPLHLDLLGLVVDLNQVVLDITAESGPGNLLGNLLCAVVGLLDNNGALTQITGLLNQILAILQGL